jgi:hypothetical protein
MTDASGTGNGTPSGKGGESEKRKAMRKWWENRQKIIRAAQRKHKGKKGKK